MRSEADRFKELYDVEKHVMAVDGGVLVEDPYPALAELRAQAPVHEGSARELIGLPPGGLSGLPRRPGVLRALLRGQRPRAPRERALLLHLLRRPHHLDVRQEHPRDGGRRAPAQPGAGAAGVLAEAVAVVDRQLDRDRLVDEAVSRVRGRAVAPSSTPSSARGSRCRPSRRASVSPARRRSTSARARARTPPWHRIPMRWSTRHERTTEMLRRVIDERREHPQDDVITMLVETEIEEDGERHLLTDDEIYGFARLILTAGSGTTWRQLGILLVGLLRDPGAARRGARRPRAAAAGDRRGGALGAHRPHLPAPGDGGRRAVRRRDPRGRGGRDGARRRQPRSRSAGTSPTGSIPTAIRSPTWASPAGRTCASACTWRARRCSSP